MKKKKRRRSVEWLGGIFSMPFYVAEDEPYRPDLALWFDATNKHILAYELHVPPAPGEAVVQLLETAMRNPMIGPPRRPARIRVEDDVQAERIRRRFGDEIDVRVGNVSELQEVFASMGQMPMEEPDEEAGGYLSGGKVPPEVVETFFRAAARLYRKAPWKYMIEEFLLGLDIPSMGIRDACISIMGHGEENYGFLLFESINDFETMAERSEQLLSGRGGGLGIPLFSVNFDRGSDLPKSMRKEASRQGWEIAGPNAFPSIVRMDADGIPIPSGSKDFHLATACSEALVRLFEQYEGLLEEGLLPSDPATEEYDLQELPGRPAVSITVPHPEALWLYGEDEEEEEQEQEEVRAEVDFSEGRAGLDDDEVPRASLEKVGRNKPCPCGSGRKYKKCCLGKEEVSDEVLLNRICDAHDRLANKLMDHAEGMFGDRDLERAIREFCSLSEVDWEDLLEVHAGLFFPWFFFNWIPSGGRAGPSMEGRRTIAETYAAKRGRQLSPVEQRLIEATAGRPFSFYEVLDCEPGEGFKLANVLTGEEREVSEKMASERLRIGDIIYCRPVWVENVSILIGCGNAIIPPSHKPELIRLRRRLAKSRDRVTEKVLNEQEATIHRVYLDLYEALSRPPELCNTDGDPLLFHKVYYEIDSPEAAFEGLKNLSVTEDRTSLLKEAQRDAGGNLLKVTIPWTRKGFKGAEGLQNTSLGTIAIDGGSMTVEVNSAARAKRIRREIKRRLGDHAVYKTTVTTSPESLVSQRPGEMPRPGGADADGEELLEIPEVREQFKEFVQKNWLGWMDKKIPALGGQTPRQAVKNKDGRESVEAILLDAERNLNDDEPFGEFSLAAVREIRKELGLE